MILLVYSHDKITVLMLLWMLNDCNADVQLLENCCFKWKGVIKRDSFLVLVSSYKFPHFFLFLSYSCHIIVKFLSCFRHILLIFSSYCRNILIIFLWNSCQIVLFFLYFCHILVSFSCYFPVIFLPNYDKNFQAIILSYYFDIHLIFFKYSYQFPPYSCAILLILFSESCHFLVIFLLNSCHILVILLYFSSSILLKFF